MDKRFFFQGNAEQERTAFFVQEDRNYLTKRSSSYHPEVMKYLQDVKPIPNLVQVLLTALGATEFWPQNANGDRFREAMLKPARPDYGHKTFETDANYFTHHVNKDPLLAKGKVLKAFYNEKARRVELIVGIDVTKDQEATGAIDRGEDLAFSMGCKVPYDVCTICFKKAKNKMEYCDHARYMMNQIDQVSGQLVGVDNINPRFFDISRVLIPADKTAFMWLKIASAANPFYGVPSAVLGAAEAAGTGIMKAASEYREQNGIYVPTTAKHFIIKKSDEKNADMIKRVETTTAPKIISKLDDVVPKAVAKLEANSPTLGHNAMAAMVHIPLSQIMSTFLSLGMIPKPEELSVLCANCGAHAVMPEIGSEHFNGDVARHLLPMVDDRSYFRPQLTRRIILLVKREQGGEKLKKTAADLIAESSKDLSVVKANQAPPKVLTPLAVASIIGAMYALFGSHSTGTARGIGKLISDHPFLALSLGAGTLRALQSLQGDSVMGSYDLDDKTRGFYNNDWQSRFVRQQARPTTVIKTGTAKYDTQFSKKLLFGVPAIYLGSAAARMKQEANPDQPSGAASKVLAKHPDVLSVGLLGEHLAGKPVSKHIEHAIESGKRLFKHASLTDLEFINALPSPEWELVSDLAILNGTLELAKN